MFIICSNGARCEWNGAARSVKEKPLKRGAKHQRDAIIANTIISRTPTARPIQSGESTHTHDHVITPVSLRTINTIVKRPVKPIPVPVLLLLLLLLIFHSPFCFFCLYLYTSSCICFGGVAGLRCARKYSRCAFLLILS